MIPYSRQNISNKDIQEVTKVLKSNYITQGNLVPRFEKKLSKKLNVNFSVVMNSATSALHIACLSLGLKENDILWTVPNTFVASANCAKYCGAEINFVDIDFETGNMSVSKLEEKLIVARKKNKLPKIIIPVHFGGQITEQKKIWNLAKQYGFKIIEDASHSLGASQNKIPVGNCKWSDITIFSFHPVKIITTAEGGVATTNSKKLYNKMKTLHLHGVTNSTYPLNRGFYSSFSQEFLGYNYRMNDIQAALGLSQLTQLDKFVKKRNELSQSYISFFKNTNINPIKILKGNISSCHLFVIRPKNLNNIYNNKKTIQFLRKKGLGVNLHYFPVHLQPYYRRLGFKLGDFINSETHAKYSISIPLFVSLSSEKQSIISKILINYYNSF